MMYSSSIHSPADSLVLSSSFDSIYSLSPPPTPGGKRSYYPDQLEPMPEFLSSSGSLLSADHIVPTVMSGQDEAREDDERQLAIMARHPIPTFVLNPKSSMSDTKNTKGKIRFDNLDQIPPLPLYESSITSSHHRMAFEALPRLPSLSDHDNNMAMMNELVLAPEHHKIVAFNDKDDENNLAATAATAATNKNVKLPPFTRTGMVDRNKYEKIKRNSLVARSA